MPTVTPTHPPFVLHHGDALDAYDAWAKPSLIMSDGAYGVGGFPGDPHDPDRLDEWYAPHIAKWSEHATPATTLWFWNTEVGWATVHPLLKAHGWQYEGSHTWDKGVGQVAGNVNSKTIRRFPVVTELCVFYSRKLTLLSPAGDALPVKEWLRNEWLRSGLTLNRANEACGVKSAATRKYLAQDRLWYFPPGEMVAAMAAYLTQHGKQTQVPYFSIDGEGPVTASAWDALRYVWTHQHGVTNVWNTPTLRDHERIRVTTGGLKSAHLNQKPLELMRRILTAASAPGDVVWEPFGGLCSGSVAAVELGRRAFAAEPNKTFHDLAAKRLRVVGGAQ